jgi:hypothetical protein
MADKFPLVVDGTAIKELPNGDNLELTGSNVVGVGTVALTNLTVSGSQGSDGQVLTSTGSGIAWEDAGQTAAGIRALVDSATDSNVFTDADHSKLDGIEASADVTDAANVTSAGALMDSELTSIASVKALNQGVATTDSPTFAGITTSGTTNTANLTVSGAQGSDGQVLTSTGSGVAWEDAGGGGAWTVISSTTVSSAVASIEFTLSGYENYALKFTNLDTTANTGSSTLRLQFSVDGGSNYLGTVYAARRKMGSYDSTSTSYHGRDNQVGANHLAITDVYHGASVGSGNPLTSSNTDGMVYIYNNKTGVNNKTGIFHAIDSRGYNVAANINPFYADGAYVVTNSSVINKVKWLLAGNNSFNISHGTFTLYGLSTS